MTQKRSGTAHPTPSGPGFLVADSKFNPIYFNAEALSALTYPKDPQEVSRLDRFIADKIRSVFGNRPPRPVPTQFLSGRRHYLCSAFPLQCASRSPSQVTLAILVARNACGSIALTRLAEVFHLSQREQEAVDFLVLGLTNKQIANRMQISPNTVRTMLRMAMVKVGVSTRAGIVGRIIEQEH